MKRIITLFSIIMMCLAAQAQSDYSVQFADKDGNIIASGTTLNFTEAETDDFGTVQMPTGLYVKNTTDAAVQVGASYSVVSISNGTFQTCFPMNCVRQSSAGTYDTTSGSMAAGELRNMQTEWFPTEEGTCVVTYQLLTYSQTPSGKWMPDGNGPQITLNFNYRTAGLEDVTAAREVKSVAYYTLLGQVARNEAPGLYIKKTVYTDGAVKVEKELVR